MKEKKYYRYKVRKNGNKSIEILMYHDKTMAKTLPIENEFLEIVESWILPEDDERKSEEEKKKENEMFPKEKENKNSSNISKSKKRLRNLIDSNLGRYKELDKFLTLTCKDLKDRKKASRMLKTFIQKLRRHYGNQIQYISVMEIQDGSRKKNKDKSKATNDIHFHILLFDCPYIDQRLLQNLWGHGIVNIKKIKQYGDIAGYLANYLGDDETLNVKHEKTFFSSKGLFRPIEEYYEDIDEVLKCFEDKSKKVTFSTDFNSEFTGRTSYIKLEDKQLSRKRSEYYRLKKQKEIENKMRTDSDKELAIVLE